MDLIYCVKCKEKTNSKNIEMVKNKNNTLRSSSICCICNSKKSQFVKK